MSGCGGCSSQVLVVPVATFEASGFSRDEVQAEADRLAALTGVEGVRAQISIMRPSEEVRSDDGRPVRVLWLAECVAFAPVEVEGG